MMMTLLKVGNEIMVRNDDTREQKMVRGSTVAKEATKLKKEGWTVSKKVTPTTMWVMRKD